MDIVQGTLYPPTPLYTVPLTPHLADWAAYLLSPDNRATAYEAYATYSPYLNYLSPYLSYLSAFKTYTLLLIEQITKKPDLATIALLLVILFVSLKILDMLWQSVLFWFRLAKKIIFWGGLLVLGTWLYVRGLEGVVEDLGYWQGQWRGEYAVWKERERLARLGRQQGRGGWSLAPEGT